VENYSESTLNSYKHNDYRSGNSKESLNHKIGGKISLGDFALGKTLGEGKFGVVYQAIHKASGMLFALKKVPKEMIKSHLMVDQFILELKLQTFLSHSNILTIYAHFEDSKHIYLVLEYMEEGTLFSHLKKNKKLGEKEVAAKMRQVASAIKYLHENCIAHRDIKPENVVMSNVYFC
jgi:aurora kinase